MPMILLLLPATLLFHLSVPLGAALERIIARRLGADAPSGRKEGERKTPWLLARPAHAEFWRQDLPLCLGGLALTTASFLVGGFLGTAAVSNILVPFLASPEDTFTVRLFGPEMTVTGPQQAWLLVPAGLLGLGLAAGALLGFGALRLLLVEALSGERKKQRLEQLTAEVGHLTASRATLMDAFEAERTRIERDLHDGAQQDLVALTMSLGGLRLAAESLPDDDANATSRTTLLKGIDTAQDRAEAALRDLRETVRGIRPAVLSERGLAPALKDLAGRAPLPTSVVVNAEEGDLAQISHPVATVVYFAVSEALTNAAKHAQAERATVTLHCASTGLSAVVTDNGRGGADPERENATGLRGMAQRVESIGGRLEVSSPGGGALVDHHHLVRHGLGVIGLRWRDPRTVGPGGFGGILDRHRQRTQAGTRLGLQQHRHDDGGQQTQRNGTHQPLAGLFLLGKQRIGSGVGAGTGFRTRHQCGREISWVAS